jgi:predicted nucleic acid-binding protein
MSTRSLHVAEPPPHYQVHPPLVVDCSVLAAAVFQEEEQELAQQQLMKHELHAPFLIESEIANVAVKKFRQGFEAESHAGLDRAQELSIDLHRIDAVAVAGLAHKYRLSAYDASYLWLAADLRVPLVTFDERLARAARACLGSLA